MAAFDTPWMMSSTPSSSRKDEDGGPSINNDPNLGTVASFSPVTLSHATSANKQRSTILVHQKSPLLIATPPQITRALAYSHPFLLPLNKFAGLLTWTSGDPWESFLLVAGFWGVVSYGDVVMRYAGPLVVVMGLILGMYSRRYSPLSSTGWTGEKLNPAQKKGHKRMESEATSLKHQKTLDEIVETLKEFTSRCNLLLDPLLELTDFLSTQRTATSATTRPALTTLLIRILLVTPVWILFTFRPIQVITTKRIALFAGTMFLTWHSRPHRISRTILWRSATVRRVCHLVTGLHFAELPATQPANEEKPDLPPRPKSDQQEKATLAATAAAKRRPDAPGVRFTFILYENQRRWVGLGWTTSLFAYERAAWTDEHLNPAPTKEEFELPDVEEGNARWRWVDGSQWLVEGAGESDEGGVKAKADATDGGQGWIYYDNKWQNGRRGVDGWGRYTRRRKWYRDAELVEVSPSTEVTPPPTPIPTTSVPVSPDANRTPVPSKHQASTSVSSLTEPLPPPNFNDTASVSSKDKDSHSLRSLTILEEKDNQSVKSDKDSMKSFKSTPRQRRPSVLKRRGTGASQNSRMSLYSNRGSDDDMSIASRPKVEDWGIGDDIRMGLE
ncbi:Pex24p-domain-containing protein [Mollisia scopiformis]|uniref:Pex24p-domain-containing protein n=1 Tax=Mollisia scopiformis TaxID=149040 RepID=A0A194XKK5_MOLSC|nr:Pex24p-domain-containing protein [Mollisia scopiformis]KUJ20745.1 Pex24p-domain-containing protein [Mollisia scopiformis]